MKIICLTGGIASGKSTAARLLESLGAKIIDADKLGHKSYNKGTSVYDELVNTFGEKIIGVDNEEIDRKILGALVFNNKTKLKTLTDIVWPSIRLLAETEIESLKKVDKQATVVLEAAVLIEAGWETIGTETWVIEVDPEVAVERIMVRNKMSQSEARSRINSQLTNQERAAKADVIITNNGSTERFFQEVKKCWLSSAR
ncbi:dephospho-CoA kinase [Gammaproteobacteria bacterium]|nr:dephospho-CoA kinase [Gammaproteobacteria bacterium]